MDAQELREREQAHDHRTKPWAANRQARRLRGEHHPIEDFLFEYYPYSMAKLTTWHPGWGVCLERSSSFLRQHRDYVRIDDECTVGGAGLLRRCDRLKLASTLLHRTHDRTAQFNCFGLHEWAMVLGTERTQVRHADYPLRVDQAAISAAISAIGLRCTHLDAYRFFTESSLPLNEHRPTRATQAQFEQPGCVHVAMDLYKYAMWAGPYLPSELVADCFDLARVARLLDMQASPYDFTSLGVLPIEMETPAGRTAYVARQRVLSAESQLLRARLLERIDWLLDITADLARIT